MTDVVRDGAVRADAPVASAVVDDPIAMPPVRPMRRRAQIGSDHRTAPNPAVPVRASALTLILGRVALVITFVSWAAYVLLVAGRPAHAIDIQRVVSPGGIEAWLVRDEKNPIIAIDFSFEGGSELDPDGKGGLANMLSTLLDEGAGDLDSQSFQKQLEDNSIELSFSAGRDGFFGSITTLRDTSKNGTWITAPGATEERVRHDRTIVAGTLLRLGVTRARLERVGG